MVIGGNINQKLSNMSCHTWSAKKVDRSIVEARKLFITERKKFIKEWKDITYNPANEFREHFKEDYTQEKCEQILNVYKRQLRVVQKGLCNVAVMKNQPEHSYFIPDKGFFINLSDHGNQFRINTYPDDWLFSRKECMQFIENNTAKILFYDDTFERLDDFWTKYPDGCIHFG